MKLCTILFYDQTGHTQLYGPCAILTDQRKALMTHSEYVIFFLFSTAKMVALQRLIIALYVDCLSFVYEVFCRYELM